MVRYESLTLDVESDASEAYTIDLLAYAFVGVVGVAYVCRILEFGFGLAYVNNSSYCTGQSVGSRIQIWSTT